MKATPVLMAVGALAVGVAVGMQIDPPSASPEALEPVEGPPATRSAPPMRSQPPAATKSPAPPAPRATRPASPAPARPPGRLRPLRVIDGDTVAAGSVNVRLLGIDTPEAGECGFDRATAFTQRFLRDGGRITNRSGYDRYGRLLAYVSNERGRDLGAAEIYRGLANARYDSTDGYDFHPHESWYRRLDARTRHVCGPAADALGGP